MKKARQIQSRPPLPGEVISSEVLPFIDTVMTSTKTGDSRKVQKFAVKVRYRFERAGSPREADQVRIGDNSLNFEPGVRAVVGRSPPGRAVTVYCDPSDPGSCVLEREITGATRWPLPIGAVAVAGGLLWFAFGVFR